MPNPKPAAICPHCRRPVKALQMTWREMETLEGILAQKSTKEIAYKMCISVKTVESFRNGLFEKTGADNIVGLVKWALEQGFEFAQVER
jgi:DNA-binding CsgD family transcriptional regulator